MLADERSRLGEARFVTAWDAGKRLSLGETIELVRRSDPSRSAGHADARPQRPTA